MLSQKYGSPSNKDLKIAVTFQQKSIELGT